MTKDYQNFFKLWGVILLIAIGVGKLTSLSAAGNKNYTFAISLAVIVLAMNAGHALVGTKAGKKSGKKK